MLTGLDVHSQTLWQEAVTQGLRYQEKADSVQRMVEAHLSVLSTASEPQKNSIRIALSSDEAQAAALQTTADEWFARAASFELPAVTVIESQNTREFEFAILPGSPYSAAKPIPVDVPLPGGVAYKIQLGAFRKPLPANTYKGLSPLSGERLSNGVTKYYAGLFWRFADAEDALRKGTCVWF
jgi:hypothetical protein